MFKALRSRLFNTFANWAIQRAMRTPYTHLFHDDGRPYMQRYWLLRLGMPKGWRQLDLDRQFVVAMLKSKEVRLSDAAHADLARRLSQLQEKLYPRFGIRIHRIMSSDDRAFHDHPWNFATLILRGGYTEFTPSGINPESVTVATEYDGSAPVTYTHQCTVQYTAGQLLRRKATDWHYLQLDAPETWTMFCTGRKLQRWGFLVDGLMKVPYDIYLRARRGAQP